MRDAFIFSFVLIIGFAQAQSVDRQLMKGKIVSPTADPEGIYIKNLQTENSVVSEAGGYFSIPVREGDTLMFSAVQVKGRSVRITKEDTSRELYFVRIDAMINAIDEVTITKYNNINAVSLGIVPRGHRKYTPAERRLKTASSLSGSGNGMVMSIDPLINMISGRTAMLRKELRIERKEMLLAKISQMFEEQYFTETLKIPDIYIRGFWYFAIEDKKFAEAVVNKNKFMATFLLGDLSAAYRKIILPQE